jgi:hypothetical protein
MPQETLSHSRLLRKDRGRSGYRKTERGGGLFFAIGHEQAVACQDHQHPQAA